MKKTLLTMILAGMLTLFTSKSVNAQTLDRINPFRQPAKITIFYGSGDVNRDGKIDNSDYNEIVNFHPQKDEADIDGDGIPSTSNDLDLLGQSLQIQDLVIGAKLPSNWCNLTKEQRKEWFTKMVYIDKTDTITYRPGFVSGNFATQANLNFYGFGDENFKLNEDTTFFYDTTNIQRFNLPLYKMNVSSENGNHGMNAILIGDNPLDFNDWVFFEPQTDEIVKPGSQSIPSNSSLNLSNLKWYINENNNVRTLSKNFLNFTITNNQPAVSSYDTTRLVLDRNTNFAPTPSRFTSPAEGDTLKGNLVINYIPSIDEEDSVKYVARLQGPGLDTSFSTTDTSISVDSSMFKPGSKYTLEGKVIAGNDTVSFSNSPEFYTPTITGVNIIENSNLPEKSNLSQNFPNPFNPSTKIRYNLRNKENISLKVYDVLGKELETLVQGEYSAGEYETEFNASKYGSGVYFYRLQAGDFVETKKMVIKK